MKLCDFYETEYLEHDRTSCSDENPVNAEASGDGCRRCNAIFFERADAMADALRWYAEMSRRMGDAAIAGDSGRILTLMKDVAADYGTRARTALGLRPNAEVSGDGTASAGLPG